MTTRPASLFASWLIIYGVLAAIGALLYFALGLHLSSMLLGIALGAVIGVVAGEVVSSYKEWRRS